MGQGGVTRDGHTINRESEIVGKEGSYDYTFNFTRENFGIVKVTR